MKVALVHELLTMKGGAERVLRILADMFPDAPIYTLLHDEKITKELFPDREIVWSTLQKYAVLSTNHHFYLPFFPTAAEAWDFSGFDLVISSSSAFAHGIITNGNPKHLSYIHSPARYLWDRTHDILERTQSPLTRAFLSRTFHRSRVWDAESSGRADHFLAASKEVQRRIQLYWDKESTLLYPPIDDRWFDSHQDISHQMEHPEYFLIVSTLARYKRIELAIKACNKTGHTLKIVGDGRERRRLESIAGPTIEFYGRREGDELMDLYTSALATIIPGDEDFGLVPLESMACGTPVISYRSGGPLETVQEGVTGEFFDAQTVDSLIKTLQLFDHKKYSSENCHLAAKKYTRKNFEQQLHTEIARLMA